MNSQQYMEIAHGGSILERLRSMRAERQAVKANAPAKTTSHDAVTVLRAIVEEVAGASQPVSADSYLPASLVHDARQAIEAHERELGADENHIGRLSPTELSADAALIQDSLGLQPISIRLEKTLIEGFKTIATIEGLGYQTLMRQALRRFADCEMKRILRGIASDMQQYEREHEESQ